ncbi:PQQ-dependent sugar dehydrogenase [Actinopolymorpha rutila]|uniref:Glucose/arabinose dehydrogenase n=1 Tax=Actinopolymorpha rutila TaxID=446787 RepID=A0A852ZLJ1_9ACTN|nr:PQQ-dependent sugar dehydrogenase [Actinopolymorpha rutila]NYH89286.1 glucose/arabinose dehydrogenase [Actinopolymorpha rutila]
MRRARLLLARPVGRSVGRAVTGTVAAALVAGAVGCSPSSGPGEDDTRPSPTGTGSTGDAAHRPRVTGVVATGLAAPWGLAFLPDRSALVAERDSGRVRRIPAGSSGADTPGSGRPAEVGRVPGVQAGGEGGLLGLAVASTFQDQPYVYAYLTTAKDNRIVRMRYADGRLGSPEVLLTGIPSAGVHNGGRMVFGPDGMLYVGTGDATDGDNAQDRRSLGGKILRLTPDGKPAPGNPFGGSPVWSYGHRNVQGLAFDPDGRLWAGEFGQDTWDELNLIRRGGNYGWPQAEGISQDRRSLDPVAQWPTSDASPSGLAYADGALWMAGLRGRRLWRIPVRDGRRAGEPQAYFTGTYGRLRTVAVAPDGSLWLSTSNTDGRGAPEPGDDRVLRLRLP